MNTVEKNLVIAQFLGFTEEKNIGWYDNDMMLPQHVYDSNEGNCFNEDELLFSESWDWLMPAIEKCTEKQTNVNQHFINNITKRLLKNDILATFSNVLNFIEFYNKQSNQ